MKIIGINGSPRLDKNSASMLDAALAGAAAAGAETERIDLFKFDFTGCLSCFACKRYGGESCGKCALEDGLSPLIEKIFEADALVIASPIYFADVPGAVRNLFERLWFPGLLYSKDGTVAYDKRMKIGLIYTMNLADEHVYDAVTSMHKFQFERFFGETEQLFATDTCQFDDYSKYASSMFDTVKKKENLLNKLPEDCRKAQEMGARLVK